MAMQTIFHLLRCIGIVKARGETFYLKQSNSLFKITPKRRPLPLRRSHTPIASTMNELSRWNLGGLVKSPQL